MPVNYDIKSSVTLTLTIMGKDHIKLLKDMMQNPISSQESTEASLLRERLFNAANAALKKD